jgi:uncharacterized protein HemY
LAWEPCALACLKAGDEAAYRKLCTELLKDEGDLPSPAVANGIAWVCALGPDAVGNYARPLALAEWAVRTEPGSDKLNTLGAVLYRAGRFREAVERLGASVRAGDGRAEDWAFLAMAHARLGEEAEARQYLAKLRHSLPRPGAIWDNLQRELLFQQAQAAVEGTDRRGR